MRFFSFTIPLLNRIFVLGASSIPWLALKPFSRLSKWDRQWWGCLLLYPLLCMTLVTLLNQACGLQAKQALVKDLAFTNFEGYRVRLSCDCSVPHTCEVDLDQERRLLPWLLLTQVRRGTHGLSFLEP